jgi:transposase
MQRSADQPGERPSFTATRLTRPASSNIQTSSAPSTDQSRSHLAATIETWWPQIEAFILTGLTNAGSEGVNRLIKLEARNAYGFHNPINQRLRSRCASNRGARRPANVASIC